MRLQPASCAEAAGPTARQSTEARTSRLMSPPGGRVSGGRSLPRRGQPEARDHGEMIRGDTGQTARVHVEALAVEMTVPVDAVEREERQRGGMGGPPPGSVQLLPECPPPRPGGPFVW